MVRALLDGRKTQTRRVLGKTGHFNIFEPGAWSDSYVLDPGNADWRARDIPFAVGDRLWVKETWRAHKSWDDQKPSEILACSRVWYEADRDNCDQHGKVRVSIFMPRWASRLTLIVTEVRVERLNDCSEADARAEGAIAVPYGVPPGHAERDAWHHGQPMTPPNDAFETALHSYRHLWNHINGSGAWEANPWVVAVSFAVVRRSIDQC